ncbi:MAG: hypothetical protein U0176_23735 [Bacteroidia bacterium]
MGYVNTDKPYLQAGRRNDTLFIALNPAVVDHDTLNFKQGKPLYFRRILTDGRLTDYRSVLVRPRIYSLRIFNPRSLQGKLEIWFEGKKFEINE